MIFTAIQYELLDQLYFTCTFRSLADALSISDAELYDQLIQLINEGLVHQMYYDEAVKDFVMQDVLNEQTIHTSAFVISKKGLLLHNSR